MKSTSEKSDKTVDQYINSFPKELREILKKVRETIYEEIPGATERISYGIPAFYVNGKYIIYYAGWKKHISVYPIPSEAEREDKRIAKYIKGKGTIQFPLNEPIPYNLIKKIIQLRIKNLKKIV